jgi:hypothetical protein
MCIGARAWNAGDEDDSELASHRDGGGDVSSELSASLYEALSFHLAG